MSKKHASLDTAFALTLLASLLRNHNLPLSTMFKDPTYAQIWRGCVLLAKTPSL